MQKYQNSYAGPTGIVIAGATVTVMKPDGTAATIYSDNGITPIATLKTGRDGEFAFYAANGRYRIILSKFGLRDEVVEDVLLFDPADNGAAQVGFVAAGAGAVARTAQDKLRDVVSAKDFGAIGDGIADDTVAIQAALNSPALQVNIPSGTYAVSNLTLGPNVRRLIGNGRPVLIARAGMAGAPIILNINARDDVLVQGVIFDGNTSNVTSFNNVVQTFMSNRVLFDMCEWRNCRGIALLASGGSRVGAIRCRWADCGLFHLTSGVRADRRQAFACTNVVRPYADFNEFERIGLDCISFATGSHNSRATNNRIDTNYAGSIYLADSTGFLVQGNRITNDSGGGNGIDVFQCTDGVIAGNQCNGNGAAGILLADVKRIAVTGNECKNNWQSGSGALPSTHRGGITLSASAANSVSNVTLAGNVCCDDQATITQRYAIGVVATGAGSFNNIRIDQSNLLSGYSAAGAMDATSIFQSTALGITGYPFSLNLVDQAEVVLYRADGTYGEFNVIQLNNGLFGKFSATPNANSVKLLDPATAYVATDTGTTQAIYYDATSNTVRLKNRTGVTRTYVVTPVSWAVNNLS